MGSSVLLLIYGLLLPRHSCLVDSHLFCRVLPTDANNADKLIGVVSQIDKNIEDPSLNDIYKTGTVAKILKVLKMPDGNTTVIIQGKKRFTIEKMISLEPYLKASIQGGALPK